MIDHEGGVNGLRGFCDLSETSGLSSWQRHALPSPGLGAFQEVAQKLLLFSSLILTTLLFLGVR
jgi:hypothetical protein